ncbi:MAG: hypothetical protein PHX13_12280 [Thiovulaceae bacterium]|nr:hypothetical protein [Sulfurimonadaceae bacterium]
MAKENDLIVDDGVELKDMSKPLLTMEDVHAEIARIQALQTTNSVRVAGIVRALNVSNPKQRFDKQTKEPILDEAGQPMFWAPYYYATIAFQGGELDINLKEDMFNELVLGKRYLFEGCKGLSFGKVQDQFHSVTVLI